MGISGCLEAKCKVCGCVFSWHLDSFPFVDAEIIGTCDKCFNKEDHDVYNENFVEDETDMPVIECRIIFDKDGNYKFIPKSGGVLK